MQVLDFQIAIVCFRPRDEGFLVRFSHPWKLISTEHVIRSVNLFGSHIRAKRETRVDKEAEELLKKEATPLLHPHVMLHTFPLQQTPRRCCIRESSWEAETGR